VKGAFGVAHEHTCRDCGEGIPCHATNDRDCVEPLHDACADGSNPNSFEVRLRNLDAKIVRAFRTGEVGDLPRLISARNRLVDERAYLTAARHLLECREAALKEEEAAEWEAEQAAEWEAERAPFEGEPCAVCGGPSHDENFKTKS
jgi:hypothetical protein